MRAQQTAIKTQVARCLESGRPLKVIIGAGETLYDGWIATDIPALNILKQQHWALLFKTESIDRLLAEHVIEHLTPAQFGEFLRIARMFLAADGQIRFAVPDGHHPDGAYIERVRPGGTGEGADDHKVLYTCDLFRDVLRDHNYDFRLLEYFDVEGQFHRLDWDAEDGFIGRSADHDARNADGQLIYTSLIIDCWPEE